MTLPANPGSPYNSAPNGPSGYPLVGIFNNSPGAYPYSIGGPYPSSTTDPNANNGGYPGVDARNQFIQGNDVAPGSNAQVFPFYDQTLTGTTTGVPYFGASLTGYNQTAQGQQTGLSDALAQSQSLGDQYYQNAINNLSSINMPDSATLEQQAQQQAGLKYDPLIQQLQNSLSSAQSNEKTASGQIGDMYNALGRALAAQIPNITNQYATAEAQSQSNYQNLQNQINNNYQGAKDAQAAELQQLGIQAALPQSTQKLNADQQYLSNQAGVNGQALNDAMRLMGQGQQDYTQRASQIAPMQGANIQSNLATQLLNLQNQVNQEIAGYKGQESAAAASLLSQLTNQAQKDYNTQQTQSLDQSYKLAELMKLTNPGAFGVAPKAPSANATKYKGASGIAQYFQDNSQTADPSQMQSDYAGFVTSPAYAQLTGPSGSGAPTLESSFQGLESYLQQNDPNITPQGLEELYNALAIKYKQF